MQQHTVPLHQRRPRAQHAALYCALGLGLGLGVTATPSRSGRARRHPTRCGRLRREVRSVLVALLDCSLALVVGGGGGEGEGGEGDGRDGVAATAAFVSASASIAKRACRRGSLFQRTRTKNIRLRSEKKEGPSPGFGAFSSSPYTVPLCWVWGPSIAVLRSCLRGCV